MPASRNRGPSGTRRSRSIADGTSARTVSPVPKIVHQPAKPIKAPSKPLLIFFGGAWDANSLLGKIFIDWENEGHHNLKYHADRYANPRHEKKFYTWDQTSEAVDFLVKTLRSDPLVPVCLVGHSFGGDTAVDVAEDVDLKVPDANISLLVTLDAVSLGAHFQGKKTKPPNVSVGALISPYDRRVGNQPGWRLNYHEHRYDWQVPSAAPMGLSEVVFGCFRGFESVGAWVGFDSVSVGSGDEDD